ncbi:MAG: DUF5688 family protein [Clostridiales bacterium]|nr:DUF5688 family protein [Clostridiales bacterium]
MITVEEFREKVVKELNAIYGREYEAFPLDLAKNNGVRRCGISVKRKDALASPVVYLEGYYKDYQDGMEMDEIILIIRSLLVETVPSREIERQVATLNDFETVREYLQCRLINYSANEDTLRNQVFRRVCDLALVLEIVIHSDEMGSMTMRVQKKMTEDWGMSDDELLGQALENGKRKNPARFFRVESLLKSLVTGTLDEPETGAAQMETEMEPDLDLYVLTVNKGIHGAVAMMYPGCLEKIADELGSDLVILPSSIHETLIFSRTKRDDWKSLRQMVYTVNRQHVEEEERLSDQVYVFCRISGTLALAA